MADDAQLTHLLAAWRNDISSAAASGKRVLITGARGQVGLLALHHWLAAGAEVVALTRKAPLVFSHPRLSWVQGDLAEPASFNSLASTFPETLIFTAPIWFLPPLLPSLARAGVKRVVAFSSTSVHSKKTSG